MSIPAVLEIVALILALIDEVQARGTSLVAWPVALLCVALLWGRIG